MTSISSVQQYLTQHKIDAYIITRNNMFLGQDVLEEENKIKELSGFTGSAGNMIIFRDKVFLLVDGRYDIQARQQTAGQNIEVVCTRDSIGSFIQHNIEEPCKFLYDSWCHSISEVDYWKRVLQDHEFIEDKDNILGSRISSRQGEIFELEESFSGISSEEKISYLTKFCLDNKLDGYFLSECDCVSWLMNLRSDLIKYTPIIRAFALVSASGEVSLFINDFSKLEQELELWQGKKIGLSYNRTPKKLQSLMKTRRIWLSNLNNPVNEWKACKNPVEIAGIKSAHLRDGVAMCKFLSWLSGNWQGQDELSVAAKLEDFRKQGDNYYSLSFATIAGCGANGAIVHYQADAKSNHALTEGSLLLLDSGAQYFDGTTDITRTIALGKPSAECKSSYTQVLKAHIAVSSSLFPLNTPGLSLDAVSRAVLWRYGKDYAHGTGHGVGHFLSVHEGPQSLSLKSLAPLQKDMIVSIEPGFYKEGEYGIRIENLALIVETSTEFMSPMLKFEPLSLVPFDQALIDKSLLNAEEINWLNNYHKRVWQEVSPLLDPESKNWLQKACAKI